MDFKNIRHKKALWRVLIFSMGILMLPLNSTAESNFPDNFSFDDCDPFEARARIMAVNGKKALLVAAEQTIYVVDWRFKDQYLTTELSDADGDPLDFGALRPGQWIHVKGFKHIDGGVVASMVQQIDPPDRPKPVLRKIDKQSRDYRRIKRQAARIKN